MVASGRALTGGSRNGWSAARIGSQSGEDVGSSGTKKPKLVKDDEYSSKLSGAAFFKWAATAKNKTKQDVNPDKVGEVSGTCTIKKHERLHRLHQVHHAEGTGR